MDAELKEALEHLKKAQVILSEKHKKLYKDADAVDLHFDDEYHMVRKALTHTNCAIHELKGKD